MPTKAEALDAQTTTRRRWVTPSHGLQIMEPHEEKRDPATKVVLGYKVPGSKDLVPRTQLRLIKFRPARVYWPPRSPVYTRRTMGVFATDDPREIALLEAEADRLRKSGRPQELMEYPEAWEAEVLNDKTAYEYKAVNVEE